MATRTIYSLIEQALYLAGVADAEFSPIEPASNPVNQGALILQQLFSTYRYDVPFFERTTIQKADELINLNMAFINYVKYFLGSVSYPLRSLNQSDFALAQAVENINAPPSVYYFNQKENKIEVYPFPIFNGNDKFEIGYLPLTNVKWLEQPIPSAWPPFAQEFFEYALAKRLTHIYKEPWLYEDTLKESEQNMIYNRESRIPVYNPPEWQNNNDDVPAQNMLYYYNGGR